jgi:hypothetical protein
MDNEQRVLQGLGLREISATEFVTQVTESSKSQPVIVLLYKDGLEQCQLLTKYLTQLAHKYATGEIIVPNCDEEDEESDDERFTKKTDIVRQSNPQYNPRPKWLKIVGDKCIQGYPDRNLPTMLIYNHGEIVRQVVGLNMFGGSKTTIGQIERFLSGLGVLPKVKPAAPIEE